MWPSIGNPRSPAADVDFSTLFISPARAREGEDEDAKLVQKLLVRSPVTLPPSLAAVNELGRGGAKTENAHPFQVPHFIIYKEIAGGVNKFHFPFELSLLND